MSELKITIDQLKNYLGTGLKVMDGWGDIRKFKYTHLDDEGNEGQLFGIKPLMYRLSDLDKEIEVNGERFIPLHKLLESYCFDLTKMEEKEILSYKESMVEVDMSFQVASMLFEWHFWPFGDEFFEQGLVIDKMKVK